MANDHLFSKIPSIHSERIHRVGGELKPEVAREQYEQVLRRQLPVIDGHRGFDLVILGIGNDGHTASIFPNQMHLWESEHWCVVAKHPTTGQYRVSLNGAIINHSRNVCFLIRGAGKARIIHEIVQIMDVPAFPAQLVKPVSGNLLWFMDREAGKEIQP
jgi:6-phosphogluconolactonase